jgi:hypothetical protein
LSMETGVIDGIVTCPMLYKAYKLQELGKHAVVAAFGCVSEGVVMNKGIVGENACRSASHCGRGNPQSFPAYRRVLTEEVIQDVQRLPCRRRCGVL